jgi:PTH1 family peptidyl-tRNA hydrolase
MRRHASSEHAISAIIGLGNPGKQYEATRHNVGFRVVDILAGSSGTALQERKFQARWGSCDLEGRKVLLVQPLTYMNRSGDAVAEILRYFDISSSHILVIHDDLDLPVGRLRLVHRGGAGGHRGVLSIIDRLNSPDFPRLKLGIGKPAYKEAVEAYVLQNPYSDETAVFNEMISQGAQAVRSVLANGLDFAMNEFNRPLTGEGQ